MPQHDHPSDLPSYESAQRILSELKPALSALPEEQLRPIRVSADRAWRQAQGLHQRFEALLPRLRDEFSTTRQQVLLTLHMQLLQRALAFLAADLHLETLTKQSKSPQLRELEAKVREDDALLTHWAGKLWLDDPKEGPLVKRFRSGTGAMDSAKDVIGLSAIFQRLWPNLENSPWKGVLDEAGLRPDTFEAMNTRATEWLHLSGQPKELAASQLLRSQAYAYLDQAFRELTLVARYLAPEDTWYFLQKA